MKSSGIKWIGDIPDDWELTKLKYTGSFEHGLSYSPKNITNKSGILVLRSSNIQEGRLDFHDCVFVREAPQHLMIKRGDIIICSCNGSAKLVGKCVYIDDDMPATFGSFMMRYRTNLVGKFSFYALQAVMPYYRGHFATTTINQLTIKTARQIIIPLPPLETQTRIANYLDKKCELLDKLISTLRTNIANYKKWKAAIIHEAVTKGLDTNAKMKPSGIEWVGDIPENWEINKIKYVGVQSTKRADNTSGYIGLENIGSGTGKYIKTSDKEFEPEGASLKIEPGDLLFAKLRPYLAKCYLAEKSCCASTEFIVIKPLYCNAVYLKYVMLSPYFVDFVNSSTYGVKMPRTNWDFVGNTKIPFPPESEQERIASYLDKKISAIDKTISLEQNLLHNLGKYKRSLIYECVTGKVSI